MGLGHRRSFRLAWIVGVSVFFVSWGSPSAQAAPFTLTVSIAGTGSGVVYSNPGGIICPSDCGETYEQGTNVSLSSFPGGRSYFAGWTGGGCSGSTSCSTTINADTSVSATFDEACSYDGSTKEVSIKAGLTFAGSPEGNLFPIEVKQLEIQEGQIFYEGGPCSGATVLNTDAVRMTGDIPAYTLLDLGKTGFAPGAIPEPEGVPEIELYFEVTGSRFMSIMTTGAREIITFGDQGWNLNGDDDIDVFSSGIGSVMLESEGGADMLSGQGGKGTGSPTSLRLSLYGNDGPDRLVGTDLQNDLGGGKGRDTIIAHRGNDWVSAWKGADVVRGGGGRDRILGGRGADTLNGGQGVDNCLEGKGRDVTHSCEKADRNL